MKNHPPTTRDNFLVKIEELHKTLPPGSIELADVLHDTWCDRLNDRGFCNCDPDIRLPKNN